MKSEKNDVKDLSMIKEGSVAIVKSIKGEARFISRITSMGITVGSLVTILRNEKKQPILIYGRDTLIAINRDECLKIEVGGVI